MKKKSEKREIVIKDTERAIYEIYLKEKGNRFANAFKMLLLRRDFYDFLDKYQGALFKNLPGIAQQHKNKAPELNWNKANPLLEQFLDKIKRSEHAQSLDKRNQDELMKTLFYFLRFYYPYYVFTRTHEIEKGYFVHDDMLNFSKIYHHVFYQDNFEKYFPRELYFGEQPPIGDLTSEEKDKRRVLQIICDDDVGKEELKQYIDEYWNDIAMSLNQNDGDRGRDKASNNFLRDIDLYNHYVLMTDVSSPRREYRVAEEAKAGISGDYIRKLIFDITNLENAVNNTKNDREK